MRSCCGRFFYAYFYQHDKKLRKSRQKANISKTIFQLYQFNRNGSRFFHVHLLTLKAFPIVTENFILILEIHQQTKCRAPPVSLHVDAVRKNSTLKKHVNI